MSGTGGSASLPLLPTPTASDGTRGPDFAKADRPGAGGDDLTTTVARLFDKDRAHKLFKTPTANLSSNGAPQHPDKRKAGGHGPNLDDEVSFLLPVDPDEAEEVLPGVFHSPRDWWADYGPAVHRWEILLGSPAPIPVEFGPRGGRRLAAVFAEWLMGLPRGWVTFIPGLNRARQLRAIGNGAMSQQAFTAYLHLLNHKETGDEDGEAGDRNRLRG
ncbi:DNA (cytosine-5-)-methyltransferase [Kitasatospora sp. NPDC058170]|uniref:DNA (cytosine-5-)-methyltransferase n=1 Tax=Kitasatospora sp. NPDC058170 TaxID=3346364 RepID=UPI0036DA5220